MKLLSVNVGLPREVTWRGRTVRTSIWKEPVEGRSHVGALNVEGDAQSDLSVHGGAGKAIYAYPSEHYPYWRSELPEIDLNWGAFGENFTLEGLLESEVRIGDRLSIGSAEFMVTQPRLPCLKLAIRLDRPEMVKTFLESRRTGFYLAVIREGDVGKGDSVSVRERVKDGVTISEFLSLYAQEAGDAELLRRVLAAAALPDHWKDYFRRRFSVE